MSLQDDIQASVDTLFSTLLKDEVAVAKPVAVNYLTALTADPSLINAGAASAAFLVNGQAVLPQIGSVAIKDTATSLKALIELEADKLLGTPAGTTTAAVATQTASA